jgi:PKD repeat protein
MDRWLLLALLMFLRLLPATAQDPCAGLAPGFTHQDHPDGLQFTDTSAVVGAVIWYQWSFGDGNTSFLQAPVHTYAVNGTYEVCLAITTLVEGVDGPVECAAIQCALLEYTGAGGAGCVDFVASFAWTVNETGAVVFLSTTEPVGGTNMWQFGDGNSGTGTQVTHTYAQDGLYTACLVSYRWDDASQELCIDSYCGLVTVGQVQEPCTEQVASFTGTPLDVLTLLFESTSLPPADSVNWNFGDNSTATGAVVEYSYATLGTYQVCMTAWWTPFDGTVCWSAFCDMFHLVDSMPCESIVPVPFSWSGTGGGITFTAGGDTTNALHSWDLGDGSTAQGAELEHAYGANGIYPVCLTTTLLLNEAADTCWYVVCDTITVTGTGSCADLQPYFTGSSEVAGMQFTDSSTVPGSLLAHVWDFGDGSTGIGNAPFHAYPAPGTYTVCLTVNSLVGTDTCSATWCGPVVWNGATGDPCIGYTADFSLIAQQGPQFTFSASAQPLADGMYWDVEGGGSTGNVLTHHFSGPGQHEVCLTAWWWLPAVQDTCYSTVCQTFTSTASPCEPPLLLEIAVEEQGESVQLNVQSQPEAYLHLWSLGDGNTATGSPVDHVFNGPGPHTICLSAGVLGLYGDTCWTSHCIELDLSTNLKPTGTGSGLQLYPVPALDRVWLAGGPVPTAPVEIHGVDGRLLERVMPGSWPLAIPVAHLPRGLLFLRVVRNGKIHHLRLLLH